MKQPTRPGISVWNNKQGWTCEKLPNISEGELAIVIQMRNGITETQMKKKLVSTDFEFRVCHIGKNDPKAAQETKLVYFIEMCKSYDRVMEVVSLLQSLDIPVSSIGVLTSRLV